MTPQLSPRERDVLHLLCRGYANAEIMEQLDMKRSTVRNTILHICQRWGVHNRNQVVIAAFALGHQDAWKCWQDMRSVNPGVTLHE